MRTLEWLRYLEEERRAGKVLFAITELAHAAHVSRAGLNVELNRLVKRSLIVRYAHALYGLPGAVQWEQLLPAIDAQAYITGAAALQHHAIITQAVRTMTCFSPRRSPRARERRTPLGRLVLVCVRGAVYAPPRSGVYASPEQALCDIVYLCRRDGIPAAGLYTFDALSRLDRAAVADLLPRYPATVGEEVRRLLAGQAASGA